eukprot:4931656-Amphidinium_carterae.1
MELVRLAKLLAIFASAGEGCLGLEGVQHVQQRGERGACPQTQIMYKLPRATSAWGCQVWLLV